MDRITVTLRNASAFVMTCQIEKPEGALYAPSYIIHKGQIYRLFWGTENSDTEFEYRLFKPESTVEVF